MMVIEARYEKQVSKINAKMVLGHLSGCVMK